MDLPLLPRFVRFVRSKFGEQAADEAPAPVLDIPEFSPTEIPDTGVTLNEAIYSFDPVWVEAALLLVILVVLQRWASKRDVTPRD